MDDFKNETDIFRKADIVLNLIKGKGLRIVQLAKNLKVTSSYICHLIRLKKLPDIVVDGYYSNMISSSHLFLISRLRGVKETVALYEKILAENLTVKQSEEEVRRMLHQTESKGIYLSEDDKDELSKKIKAKFPELKSEIIQTRIKGKVIFEIKGSLEKTTKVIKELGRSFI